MWGWGAMEKGGPRRGQSTAKRLHGQGSKEELGLRPPTTPANRAGSGTGFQVPAENGVTGWPGHWVTILGRASATWPDLGRRTVGSAAVRYAQDFPPGLWLLAAPRGRDRSLPGALLCGSCPGRLLNQCDPAKGVGHCVGIHPSACASLVPASVFSPGN